MQDSIVKGDIVLIHIDEKPAFYGRVENISPDMKPKWWQAKLVFFTVPYQITTWILDDEQIRGADFTMGGTPIRIEKIVIPQDEDHDGNVRDDEEEETTSDQKRKASVLSMHKKK